MNKKVFYFIVLLAVFSCKNKDAFLFEEVKDNKSGITFHNQLIERDDLNILDYLYFYNGGGVAVGDINGDDLPDIFFSGNQVKNQLYLNKGNLKFENITDKAGVAGNSSWNTGAVMGDVNGDGLLDIYVSAVVGINGFDGYNELYINNGPSTNGTITFTESAKKYGLDQDSYSSNAAFLDYDLDGDLDMYLLNHAVHTQDSYGKAEVRKIRNYETGDKLLRNDGSKFTDVSEEAGIYGGVNGYGLGVAISDFNQDGYPDIYVGNDFHEDDYFYLNNADGTFSEKLREHFGHTARFSMGNDAADINHDGWVDLISLDMLPEQEKILKSSEGADNIQAQKIRTERFGYHYQYSRNMLFVNDSGKGFQETALSSGVAATDWSWSALFCDFNQDAHQDLFVSNGIPKRPNDLDYIKYVSNEKIQNKLKNTKLMDQKALSLMPSGSVHNYIFEGKENLTFKDQSGYWIAKDSLKSGGTAYADFDKDGDLDLVINNINGTASIFENKTNQKANYLKLNFHLPGKNPFGIGTKIYCYHNGQLQFKELYTVRGFQSSSEPMIHFGYGDTKMVDSLKIIWPDQTYQILKNVKTNQELIVSPSNTKPFNYQKQFKPMKQLFTKVEDNLGINFVHEEDDYTDFNRQRLLPYQLSDRGPAVAVGDIDNDGTWDVFFGGSKFKPSQVYLRKDTIFSKTELFSFIKDSVNEDITAVLADFDKNGQTDLLVGTGGGDFYNKMKPLKDIYYAQIDSTFQKIMMPDYYNNASVLKTSDIDSDGDLDIFVGNHFTTNDFGSIPSSFILINEKGTLKIEKNDVIEKVGMVTDAIFQDLDGDGDEDLIIVGEWMAPSFFQNDKGAFSKIELGLNNLKGLWQSIAAMDIDLDGDTDYIVGNWGTNSKFKASAEYPMKMYYADFDANGQTETIVATYKKDNYYPLESFDELAAQLQFLKKKFTSYSEFAGKSIKELFSKEMLQEADILEVEELRSGFLRNTNGKFEFVPFDNELQTAPILSLLTYDFDQDGHQEVLAGGNYFGVKPIQGRFDSFAGALIFNETEIKKGTDVGLRFLRKSIRSLDILKVKDKSYLLVTFNNEAAEVYAINRNG